MNSKIFKAKLNRLIKKYNLTFDFDCDYVPFAEFIRFYTSSTEYIFGVTNPLISCDLGELMGMIEKKLTEYYGEGIR